MHGGGGTAVIVVGTFWICCGCERVYRDKPATAERPALLRIRPGACDECSTGVRNKFEREPERIASALNSSASERRIRRLFPRSAS